jgi:uridine kinase
MRRQDLLRTVASRIVGLDYQHPVRVGVDGVDASGKTTFADELAAHLRDATERAIIRASIDGFHNPRAVRVACGKDSPEGYYRNSFDNDAIVNLLLRPLGSAGSREMRRKVFDFRTDQSVQSDYEIVAPDAILVFDGVFLHRPELRPYWDFTIFLHVPFDITVARAEKRDTYLFGDESQVRDRYEMRYVPGQNIYLAEANPMETASMVIDNSDFEDLAII